MPPGASGHEAGEAARLAGEIEVMETAAAASARRTQRLYEEVSKLSLGTAQDFYRVSRDFELRTTRAMSPSRLLSACLAAALGGLAIAWLAQRRVPRLRWALTRGTGGQKA